MKDKVTSASNLLSSLSKTTNREHTSQLRLVKYPNSVRVKDLLINKTIPVTLWDNLLTFCDTGKKFEVKKDLLKMIINKNYYIDLADLPDKKIMFEFCGRCVFR